MFGPVVEGERVRLEPPRVDCASIYLRWFADMEVTRYLLYRHPPSLRQEGDFLDKAAEDPHVVLWSIAAKEDGRLIGATALEKIDWRTRDASSGIVIGERSEWRRGRASEAMRLRTEYAFAELGLRKLWTGVWLPNHGSRRALEKAGYRQCGLMRRHAFVAGRWLDVWLAELHREDWEQAREVSCTAR
ncbi:MAG TPA: GNAT family protein [Candidatus Methylomirabilis sp.]|nr:GNAT family protein [Candidatus Methylomirabilis sp.]